MALMSVGAKILKSSVSGLDTVSTNAPISGNGTPESPIGLDSSYQPTEYSAGPNIDITNHVVSGKDWINEIISANSGKADISAVNGIIDGLSADYYPLTGNPSGFLTAHQDLSDYATTGDLTAYYPNTNPSGFITGVDLSNYYNKQETSSNLQIQDALNLKLDSATFTAYTANADTSVYSAGANIDITDHVVSGRDWTTEIESATSGKLDITASGDLASEASAAATAWANDQNYLTAVTVGSNLSGNGTYQSPIGITGQLGKIYQGQNPVVVDNSNDIIKLNQSVLSATAPLSAYEAAIDNEIYTVITLNGSVGSEYTISYSSPATSYSGNSGLRITESNSQAGTKRRVFSGDRCIGELVPSGYGNDNYLTTNSQGNLVWTAKPLDPSVYCYPLTTSFSSFDLSSVSNSFKQVTITTPKEYAEDGGKENYPVYYEGSLVKNVPSGSFAIFIKQKQNDTNNWWTMLTGTYY